jgi:hypothetical protein
MNPNWWKIISFVLLAISLGLGVWDIYAVIDNSYWAGVNQCSTFARCTRATPWAADMLKMKGKQINSCQELDLVLHPEANELAKEEL